MRNKTRLWGMYLPFFILMILGAVTLRTIAFITDFNFKYHYFISNTLPAIANALIAAVIFFFIIYIIGIKRKPNLIPDFSSPANYIPSAALAAALAFIAVEFFFSYRSYSATLELAKYMKSFPTNIAALNVISILLIFAAIFSIVYLVLNTVFIRTVSARRATFGLAIIIFFSLYLSYLYFDSSAPITSPIKTVDELTYAFTAVFFLYEIRLSLGREKWRAYLIFGFIAAALAAYSAIPAIIIYFAYGRVIANSLFGTVLTLAVLIFISSKLMLVDRLTEADESPFVTKMKEHAARREEELNPKFNDTDSETEIIEQSETPDENQISILDAEKGEEADSGAEESANTSNISDSEEHT